MEQFSSVIGSISVGPDAEDNRTKSTWGGQEIFSGTGDLELSFNFAC